MSLDLFAGVPVTDYNRALRWFTILLDREPAFFPNAVEAVWELAEHRYLYIVMRPERAGQSVHLMFVDDLDARVTTLAERGIAPAEEESYDNGVRKVTYRDPDGNEIAFGGNT